MVTMFPRRTAALEPANITHGASEHEEPAATGQL